MFIIQTPEGRTLQLTVRGFITYINFCKNLAIKWVKTSWGYRSYYAQ